MSKHVDKEALLALISEQTKDEDTLKLVGGVLKEVYEGKRRHIQSADRSSKYGQAFPINPEILADLMQSSRGKKVLEVGAARGENALLIGLAGAQEVWVNDIEPLELSVFRQRLALLPTEIQKKFYVIKGDCFQVFEDKKHTEQFDVIYARNIFHFFYGKKRDRFIAIMNRLLKPGGRLILSVNSANYIIDKKILNEYPKACVFKKLSPLLRLGKGNIVITSQYSVETDLSNVDPLNYRFVPLLVFALKGSTLKPGMKLLSKELQIEVLEAATQFMNYYGRECMFLSGDIIDCHEAQVIAYNKKTIEEAFSETRFELVCTQFTDDKGHVTEDEDKDGLLMVTFEKTEK